MKEMERTPGRVQDEYMQKVIFKENRKWKPERFKNKKEIRVGGGWARYKEGEIYGDGRLWAFGVVSTPYNTHMS